jgi:tRNA A-37 threonylcarbamoyl transferase component Bud32
VTNEVDQFGADPGSADSSPHDSSSLLAEMQQLIDEPSTDRGTASATSPSLRMFLEQISSVDDSLDTKGEASDVTELGGRKLSFPVRIGRFELTSILGSGGFGIVFRAHDPQLQRDVALKILRPEAALSPRVQRRFLQEATAAAQLEHAGIIAVYDAGQYAGLSYLAAPLCEGPNLADWFREHPGELSARQSAELIAQVAEAVQHAHVRGILHRDLKPSNILLKTASGSDGLLNFQPLLTDFGLARRLDGQGDETFQGMILGTTAYMSPEQAAGRWKDVGVTSDVFSLGVILYELLTGQRLFPGASAEEVRANVISSEPLAPRKICKTIPPDLETICLKCLTKEPHDRYLSAGELAADLRRSLSHQPIVARPAGLATQVRLWCRRRPLVATLALLFAMTLLSSAVITAVLYHNERVAHTESEEHLDVARQAVSKMYTKVADQWLIEQPEVQDLRREFLEDALRFYERIAAQRPRDERSRHDLSVALHRMANMSDNLELRQQAFEYRRKCLEIVDALRRDFPQNETYQYDAFMNRLFFAGEHPGLSKAERIAILREADSILRLLVDRHPANPVYRDALAALCVDLGYLHWENGSAGEASRLWHEGADLASDLVRQYPDRPLYAKHVATANLYLGQHSLAAGLREQAHMYFSKMRQTLDEIRARAPEMRWVDEHGSVVLGNCGVLLADAGDLESAIPLLEDCRTCLTRLIAWYPKTLGFRAQRSMMCARLAKAYTKCDRSTDALAALENGENDARKVLAETPDNSTATAALNLIRQCSEDSHVATGSRL